MPKCIHVSPPFKTMAASVRFLGGMNLSFALLSLLILGTFHLDALSDSFTHNHERAILAQVIAFAHGSQWYFNVPVALHGGRVNGSYWDVFEGPMFFVFLIDGILALANMVCGTHFLLK